MKSFSRDLLYLVKESPSPRRAWIEMLSKLDFKPDKVVALPTEGVD